MREIFQLFSLSVKLNKKTENLQQFLGPINVNISQIYYRKKITIVPGPKIIKNNKINNKEWNKKEIKLDYMDVLQVLHLVS